MAETEEEGGLRPGSDQREVLTEAGEEAKPGGRGPRKSLAEAREDAKPRLRDDETDDSAQSSTSGRRYSRRRPAPVSSILNGFQAIAVEANGLFESALESSASLCKSSSPSDRLTAHSTSRNSPRRPMPASSRMRRKWANSIPLSPPGVQAIEARSPRATPERIETAQRSRTPRPQASINAIEIEGLGFSRAFFLGKFLRLNAVFRAHRRAVTGACSGVIFAPH